MTLLGRAIPYWSSIIISKVIALSIVEPKLLKATQFSEFEFYGSIAAPRVHSVHKSAKISGVSLTNYNTIYS